MGFALVAANSGDLDRGVWAMRRAFNTDAASVSSIVLDDSLRPMVEKVTRQYEVRMEAGSHGGDDGFMLAALYQLQGDPEMAAMAIHSTSEKESSDPATKYLANMIDQEMKSMPMTTSAAWELLGDGNSEAAFSEFINEISLNPNSGSAKLGYALAAADLGHHDRGIWAARRAFEVDPEGVSDVMLSGKLRSVVQRNLAAYEKRTDAGKLDKDNAFMMAMLHQLAGDVESAEAMVEHGQLDSGDFLATLVKEEMDVQMEMMKKSADADDSHEYDLEQPASQVSDVMALPQSDSSVIRSARVPNVSQAETSYIITMPCGTRVRVIEKPAVGEVMMKGDAMMKSDKLDQYAAPSMKEKMEGNTVIEAPQLSSPPVSELPSFDSPEVESLAPPSDLDSSEVRNRVEPPLLDSALPV